ncbi:calcium-binding protein [Halomonas sp. V046]|uniref:calcium-binding protein n=1 Tax=Halomonas sp. V046 TaxID=3459611 RepID=UPI004044C493
MGLFSLPGQNAATASELAITTHALATYSQTKSAFRLPLGGILGRLDAMAGEGRLFGNDVDTSLPAGWREVSASELGLDASRVDGDGYITLDSPVTGRTPTGPQLLVLAEEAADGSLSRVSVAYAGTNSPVDVLDYFKLNAGVDISQTMEPVLSRVADFMARNGLQGEDAVITGYSLGGALANVQARFSSSVAGGFFADSSYIGHASPLVYNADNVLNIGFENDVVHRSIGDHQDLASALEGFDGFLENNDREYASSVDNVVLFNGVYKGASLLLAHDSLLNLFSWSAHLDGIVSDAVERIVSSQFYDAMSQDSAVVVSALGALDRATTWVKDSDSPTSSHFGDGAFILGTHYADLLEDGGANDFLEGFAGDDKFRVGAGMNLVQGGAGSDSLMLGREVSDYDVYRLDDGRVAVAGDAGLTLAADVERLEFGGGGSFFGMSFGSGYLIEASHLEDAGHFSLFDRDVDYADAVEGSAGDDLLTGTAVFAGAGNDVVAGTAGDDLLVGEDGDDRLDGGLGNDRLYGGEGDDVIVLGSGRVQANGGLGQDTFSASARDGNGDALNAVIEDFSVAGEDGDILDLRDLFADESALSLALSQVGSDALISQGNVSITLTDVMASTLTAANLLTGMLESASLPVD